MAAVNEEYVTHTIGQSIWACNSLWGLNHGAAWGCMELRVPFNGRPRIHTVQWKARLVSLCGKSSYRIWDTVVGVVVCACALSVAGISHFQGARFREESGKIKSNIHMFAHMQSSCVLMQWESLSRFLFNDGLFWVAVVGESGGDHPAAERNTMCAPSGRTFLPAPWFPQVIHAVLIPTVMALSWGSAALPGPPRFSLWPPWQHCPSAACQPRQAQGGWLEGGRGQEDEATTGAYAALRLYGDDGKKW